MLLVAASHPPSSDMTKHLRESVANISRFSTGKSSAASSAELFTSFRRGVTQAAGSKQPSPEALLGPLESKDHVLHLLIDLHRSRRPYRKQIQEVFKNLLQVDEWLEALKNDLDGNSVDLPQELDEIFTERLGAEEAARAARGAPTSPEVTDPDLIEAAFKEEEKEDRKEQSSGEHSPDAILEQLERGSRQMEALRFHVGGDIDLATTAFESFCKAVNQVSHSKSMNGDSVFGRVQNKTKILAFMLELTDAKSKYRSRVASTLSRLLATESWRQVASEELSMSVAIDDLMAPPPEPETHDVEVVSLAPLHPATGSLNPFSAGVASGGVPQSQAGSGTNPFSAAVASGGSRQSQAGTGANPFSAAVASGAAPQSQAGSGANPFRAAVPQQSADARRGGGRGESPSGLAASNPFSAVVAGGSAGSAQLPGSPQALETRNISPPPLAARSTNPFKGAGNTSGTAARGAAAAAPPPADGTRFSPDQMPSHELSSMAACAAPVATSRRPPAVRAHGAAAPYRPSPAGPGRGRPGRAADIAVTASPGNPFV